MKSLPNTRRVCAVGVAGAVLLAALSAAQARVTRIVIDDRQPLASAPGQAIAYEQISGRVFGELQPGHPANAIIQDIDLARDTAGKVGYTASFVITKPVDMAQASGLMWHDVPNRGTPFTIFVPERQFGDVGLASAWQGDNAAIDANNGTAVRDTMRVGGRHFLLLPIARHKDGSTVTGRVFGRIVNRSGMASQPLIVQTNPVPYRPLSLDTREATLVTRTGELQDGTALGEAVVPSSDWAWARCSENEPFPGKPDATQICVKGGFDPAKLYMVTYTAKDPYVLGIGFAAWRDVGQFFKTAAADDAGTPNPLANSVVRTGAATTSATATATTPATTLTITHSIARGNSQSGNFLRGWLHLGFNQGEDGKPVHEGLWPIIAGRRIALNFRWAQPDGVLELYQAGSEGPQWWSKHPDPVRGLPAAGILDRCEASKTCPKIMEHFGSAEVWALKLTPEWVGTDARADLPLPPNVRRYYIASTNHGGGAGGFDTSLPGVGLPTTGAMCPGNNFGVGILPANPVSHVPVVNALRVHFRNWVMKGTAPPPSVYPTLAGRPGGGPDLVDANKAAMGFPTLPGLRPTVPEPGFIMPVLDYDWGPQFNPLDVSGVPTNAPPPIRRAIRMLVPRVDADGNEVGGVPHVLTDAPLGTYLGWNVTAAGARPFHKDQICNYVGGMVPFSRTQAEREANKDPRLSLEERYGSHAGYVAAVAKAAKNAVERGFLLPSDAEALIAAAEASRVLK